MTHPTTPYRHFNGQSWPAPSVELESITYKFRHLAPDHVFSMKDRLIAASAIDAYSELIGKSQANRNAIIKELRKGPNV